MLELTIGISILHSFQHFTMGGLSFFLVLCLSALGVMESKACGSEHDWLQGTILLVARFLAANIAYSFPLHVVVLLDVTCAASRWMWDRRCEELDRRQID